MAGITHAMRLYLIRHGQTAWNAASRAQGHTDTPLDEVGLAQADCLRSAFAGIELAEVWTSDLQRSHSTAIPVAETCGCPLISRRDLRERTFGEWEGLDFAELRARFDAADGGDPARYFDRKPPGGESARDVFARLSPVAEEIRNFSNDLAVVTHGGAAALLMAHLLNGDIEASRQYRFGNAAITELRRHAEGWHTVRWNDDAHLGDLPLMSGSLDGTHR